MDKVMIFAVHPDDETLGCGGTILKHKEKGDVVFWCIVTEMKTEHGFSESRIARREKEISKVSKMYGFDKVYKLKFPTTFLDTLPKGDLIERISSTIQDLQPSILYLPFKHDVHSDHRMVFDAAVSCSKAFRYNFIKKTYMMEVLSESEFAPAIPSAAFIPNYFVDITAYLEKKLEILQVYKGEVHDHPFPRSLKNVAALATYRGATANCEYAESFMLLKEIG